MAMPSALSPPPVAVEIVVTGQGLPQAPGDAAFDIATIGRERLDGVASGRIEDVLRDVAGFAQYRRADSRSAHPTSQGATLRGLGGNASSRALVLLDGVPQVDPFGGWVSFAALDPARLGQVRVIRGGGTGADGPGALAGTIELASALPAEIAGITGRALYGDRDSIDLNGGLAGRLGGGFASISASYAQGDGFVPIVAKDRGPVDEAAPYRQASLAVRAVVPVGAETELQASALGFYDDRTRGVPFTGNTDVGVDASVRLVGRGRWGWEALGYVQLRKFESMFSSVDPARTIATETLDQYNVPATGLGGRIELRPPVAGRLTLRFGADTRILTGETDERYSFTAGLPTRLREAGGRTEDVGAFADASLVASDLLTLTAGGRADRWRIVDGHLRQQAIGGPVLTDTRFDDRSGWEGTGRAGAALTPGRAVTLRTAAYLGWRLPTLNELYRPFRAGLDATAANAGLSPERLRGVDAGVELRPLRGARLSATAFWNRLDHAIANVTLGQGPGFFPEVGFVGPGGVFRMRENIAAIRSRGIELDGSLARGPWLFSASYAYTDARVRASGAAAPLDGLRPAQTAPHQASATLAWNPPRRLLASATLRYVGAQFDDDLDTRRLRDAVTLDLSAQVPLRGRLSLFARAENVGNARVEAAITSLDTVERATPRTLWIGFKLGPG